MIRLVSIGSIKRRCYSTDAIKLKIDPRSVSSFQDLKLPNELISNLQNSYRHVSRPTSVQSKMIASLASDLSVLVKAAPGTGKSLASILYMLSYPPCTNQEPSIVNLVVVPTAQLCRQYYDAISKLTSGTNSESPSPVQMASQYVQHVYRTDKTSEQAQIARLEQKKPHILIGTPTRLLDILASDKRYALPFHSLSNVVIDEVDTLLPKTLFAGKKSIVDTSASLATRANKQLPTDLLLTYLVAHRDQYMKNNNNASASPVKFVLQSATSSNYLSNLPETCRWIQDDQPLVKIGTDSTVSNTRNRDRMPRDVDTYFVSYNSGEDQLYDVNLHDVNIRDTRPDPSFEKVLRQNSGNRKIKPPSRAELSRLSQAFSSIFEREQGRRGLMIVPPQCSVRDVASELNRLGIKAAFVNSAVDQAAPVFFADKKWHSVDTDTVFTSGSSNSDNTPLPDVLIYTAHTSLGLDFPGLSRVYVMSSSAALNYYSGRALIRIAGRCRVADAHERGEKGRDGLYKGSERGKVIVFDLQDREIAKPGLVNQEISKMVSKLGTSVCKYM